MVSFLHSRVTIGFTIRLVSMYQHRSVIEQLYTFLSCLSSHVIDVLTICIHYRKKGDCQLTRKIFIQLLKRLVQGHVKGTNCIFLHIQKHYTDIKRKSRLSFFEDRATFWTPASNSCELYSQLAEHKYREILHGQIK